MKPLNRLPSMSQCLGNKIMPKNSQIINHIFSHAISNSGQQIGKLINNQPKVRKICSRKRKNVEPRCQSLIQSQYATLKVLNIELDYNYIRNLPINEDMKPV